MRFLCLAFADARRSIRQDTCQDDTCSIQYILPADLAPLYEHLCQEIGWSPDASQLQRMQSANQAKLEELEGKIKDAEENLGDTEVKEALTAKADYLCRIGAYYVTKLHTLASCTLHEVRKHVSFA